MIKPNIIKKMVPPNIYGGLKALYQYYSYNKIIKNFYNANHSRNVLISYIVRPFKKRIDLTHTNSAEALMIAKIFDELSYNIDVIFYNSSRFIDYNKYDVVFGFGDPLINSFYRRKRKILSIYYGTGMHVCHQNQASLKRVKDVYERKGKWLPESGRIVDKTWSIQTTLVDAIITLGNSTTVDSYRKYYDGPIFNVPASFYKITDFREILRQKNFADSKHHFLWFGSSGLVHKGLDLLLEIFKNKPNLHLHICGPIDYEPGFKTCFYNELYNTENIHTHGFVDLRSEVFNNLMKTCAFVIFPSCSEGQSTSVLNVAGNGALLPIVTKESGIDINEYGIEIMGCNLKDVELAVAEAVRLTDDDIRKRSFSCGEYVFQHHSIEMFSKTIKDTLNLILST
jgi:hypothetical protein